MSSPLAPPASPLAYFCARLRAFAAADPNFGALAAPAISNIERAAPRVAETEHAPLLVGWALSRVLHAALQESVARAGVFVFPSFAFATSAGHAAALTNLRGLAEVLEQMTTLVDVTTDALEVNAGSYEVAPGTPAAEQVADLCADAFAIVTAAVPPERRDVTVELVRLLARRVDLAAAPRDPAEAIIAAAALGAEAAT